MMTTDFTSTHSDATILDREAYIKTWNPALRKYEGMELKNVQVRVYQDAAVATFGVSVRALDLASKRDLALPSMQVTSVLVRQDATWKIAAMHVSRVSQK